MGKRIRTCCQGCHPECGVIVYVDGGKITRITGDSAHPSSHGFICIKGRSQADFATHPDRLLFPSKRVGTKGSGKWQRISWDRAFAEIAEGFTRVRDKYGAEAIATYHGTGPRGSMASYALADAIGTPNEICTDTHVCFFPSVMVEGTTNAWAKGQNQT